MCNLAGDDSRVAYACFPDVHTRETSKIKISTRKREKFPFLVVALVFTAWIELNCAANR